MDYGIKFSIRGNFEPMQDNLPLPQSQIIFLPGKKEKDNLMQNEKLKMYGISLLQEKVHIEDHQKETNRVDDLCPN